MKEIRVKVKKKEESNEWVRIKIEKWRQESEGKKKEIEEGRSKEGKCQKNEMKEKINERQWMILRKIWERVK